MASTPTARQGRPVGPSRPRIDPPGRIVPTNITPLPGPRFIPTPHPVPVTPPSLPNLDTKYPVLLFPIRIETRFRPSSTSASGWQLSLRVFPDQVHVDTQQDGLTPGEMAGGQQFWNAVPSGTSITGLTGLSSDIGSAVRAIWQRLSAQYGTARAAWIVQATEPPGPAPVGRPGPRFRALPDRFVAVAYSDALPEPIVTWFPCPVNQSLSAAPDPTGMSGGDPSVAAVDPGLRWAVDFDGGPSSAVSSGLGVVLDVPTGATTFVRILVLGVRSDDAFSSRAILDELLNDHHVTDGLALVPYGASTKNTSRGKSALSRKDPGYQSSFDLEFGPPRVTQSSTGFPVDGQIVADALGVDYATFNHVVGTDGTDYQDGRDMLTALWPAIGDYYLSGFALLPSAPVSALRTWAINYVSGRGAIPSIRIGNTPYGILPVTALGQWPSSDPSTFRAGLVTVLQAARENWRSAAASLPAVGAGPGTVTSPATDSFVQALAMCGLSIGYHGRLMIGGDLTDPWSTGYDATMGMVPPASMTGDAFWRNLPAPWANLSKWMARPAAQTAIQGMGLQPAPASLTPPGLFWPLFESVQTAPLVPAIRDDGVPLSESDRLPDVVTLPDGVQGNYLEWLAAVDPGTLQAGTFPGGQAPKTLLYLLLRQSLLSGAGLLAKPASPGVTDVESGTTSGPTPGGTTSPWGADVGAAFSSALTRIASRSTAQLGRAFAETLGLFSDRLDAWMSSVAASRIADLAPRRSVSRPGTFIHAVPGGIYLGAYGWIENLAVPNAPPPPLSPTPDEAQALSDLNAAVFGSSSNAPDISPPQEDNVGRIHAPSLDQAAALAVLRTANLTHRTTSGGQTFAIDLAAKRTRLALGILDGMRAGDTLGALLGSRFESEISDALAANPNDAGVQGATFLIPDLRAAYPLSSTVPGATPDSSVPDGLAMQAAYWAAGGRNPGVLAVLNLVDEGSPAVIAASSGPNASAIQTALQSALDVLDRCVEALGDLTLAEGIYQVLRGNPSRAGAILETTAQGGRPPDIQVANTPTRGTDFTHRVLVELPPPQADPPTQTPRALAEPRIEAWASSLLPDPANVVCAVSYTPAGTPDPPVAAIPVTLADLGIGAMDLLEFAVATDGTMLAELGQRVLCFAGYGSASAPGPGVAEARVLYDPPGALAANAVSLGTVLGLARALKDVLAHARSLTPNDLHVPGLDPAGPADPAYKVDEIAGRAVSLFQAASDARSGLSGAADALSLATASPTAASIDGSPPGTGAVGKLRAALLEVSGFGIPLSVPPWPTDRASSIGSPAVSLASSPSPPGGTEDYTVSLVTSPSGALASGVGTVTLLAPRGTSWPVDPSQYACTINGATAVPTKVLRLQPHTVVVTVPADVPASTAVSVEVSGVANPGAGSFGLSIRTSSDPEAATVEQDYIIGTPGSGNVSGIQVNTDAKSGKVAITFTSDGSADPAKGDAVSILGPDGMAFSESPTDYSLVVNNSPVPAVGTLQLGDGSVTFPLPSALSPGDNVVLAFRTTGLPPPGFYRLGLRLAQGPVSSGRFLLRPEVDALLAQATRVLGILGGRIRSSLTGPLDSSGTTPAPATVMDSVSVIQALLGRGFLVVPTHVPWDAETLAGGFVQGSAFFAGDPVALPRWAQQGSHVRPGLSRLDLALTMSAALLPMSGAGQMPRWAVGQIPVLPNDRWLALPSPARLSFVQVVVNPDGSGTTASGSDPSPSTSTYRVSIGPGPTGNLGPGSTMTLVAPEGTAFPIPQTSYTLERGDGTPVALASVQVTPGQSNQVVLTLGNSTVTPGQRLDVTIAGVTDPADPDPTGSIVAFTSADPAGVASPDYPIPRGTGVPADPFATSPNAPRVALVCLTSATSGIPFSTVGNPVAGLLIDEWPERVPDDSVTTGLLLHYNSPRAQAPQAWLLAVAPPNVASWTANGIDLIRQTVEEALDLAALRMVDLLALTQGGAQSPTLPGQYLPAAYLAFTELQALGPVILPQYLPPQMGTSPPIVRGGFGGVTGPPHFVPPEGIGTSGSAGSVGAAARERLPRPSLSASIMDRGGSAKGPDQGPPGPSSEPSAHPEQTRKSASRGDP